MTRFRPVAPVLVVAVVGAVVVAAAAGARSSIDSGGATVKLAFNAKLKTSILVNGNGLTLYAFTDDAAGIPTCLNDIAYHCSKAWPPLLAKGKPVVGTGLTDSKVGTIARSDGVRIASASAARKPGRVPGGRLTVRRLPLSMARSAMPSTVSLSRSV